MSEKDPRKSLMSKLCMNLIKVDKTEGNKCNGGGRRKGGSNTLR